MAGKSNKHYWDRLDFVLICWISSSLLITSYVLPISALASPLHGQFIIAKPPDERQPEAVEEGIEQIPAPQTPVPRKRNQPIESPIPSNVSPEPTNSSPTPKPSDGGATPRPSAPVDSTPKPSDGGATPRPSAPVDSTPKPPDGGAAPRPSAPVDSTPNPPDGGAAPRPSAPVDSTPKPPDGGATPRPSAPVDSTPKPPDGGATPRPSAPVDSTPKPPDGGATPRPSAPVDSTPKPPDGGATPRPSAPVDSTPKPPDGGATHRPSAPVDSTPKPSGGAAPRPSAPVDSYQTPKPSSRRTPSRQGGRKPTTQGSPISGAKIPSFRKIDFVDIALGILAPGNFQSQGRYFHFYQFEGRENQFIQIRLSGSADQRRSNNLSLDPLMFLLNPDNQVLLTRGSVGTDNQGVRDAFMFVRLPVKGTYTIAVTSRNPRDTGRYSLTLRNDRASYTLDESDELTQESLTRKKNGSPYNVSKFQGKKDQLISIRVDSLFEEFSPYIVLLNSKGQIIAADNDKDGRYSALIDRARLPEDDTYYVVVISAIAQERGTYRLTIF